MAHRIQAQLSTRRTARLRTTACLRTTALAAASLVSSLAAAQSDTLPTISVTGRSAPSLGVAGFGDIPAGEAPFQSSIVTTEQMRDRGVQRLADLARIDPAVSDAYNSEGYWDTLTIRGFATDNRFNFRRDGLPINAQTSIPLDNKERLEVLKGTSGIQAGTSAPGGLVNLVTKRPLDGPLRSATLSWRERNSVLGAVDISQRFGVDDAFGLRLNAALEHLDPKLRDADGKRHLFAAAGEWRLTRDTRIEAEFETSRRSQPSQPAFSTLGDTTVPAPIDPTINLNNQPWSQPVVMRGDTASLRVTHRIDNWRLSAHALAQRLKADDRLAYPFGCDAEGNYSRFCSDGTFDLYDFRTENEHRDNNVLELAAHGDLRTGDIGHRLSVGVLHQHVRIRLQDQAYNYVGVGNVDGTAVTPADPTLTDTNTNRTERSTEFFVRDAVSFTDRLTGWFGLRHTRLDRRSVRTDGSQPTVSEPSFTAPWLAASYRVADGHNVYASWGQGLESDVAPNRPGITNAGATIGPLKSKQFELGYRTDGRSLDWGVAYFRIERPVWSLLPTGAATSALLADGDAIHQGIELSGAWRGGPWTLQGGLQALHAERSGSADTTIDGKRPTNVPALSLRLLASHQLAAVPGLAVQAGMLADSDRMVREDNSVRIGGYARFDLGATYRQRTGDTTLTWRAGVDNVFDRRAWRESPFQYGHAYLYPLAGRTFRVSVEARL